MKYKTLLIGLMTLVISFQIFATTKTFYYPNGETITKWVDEYIDGKISKTTFYHKTGEVDSVQEFVNGKESKVTFYYKAGEIKAVQEFVNGNLSKTTRYPKNEDKRSKYYISPAEEAELDKAMEAYYASMKEIW